jgi:hypothetical protein
MEQLPWTAKPIESEWAAMANITVKKFQNLVAEEVERIPTLRLHNGQRIYQNLLRLKAIYHREVVVAQLRVFSML